jgi:hypothetical protein
MNPMKELPLSQSKYWKEQHEYFKEKTLAFKELKKRREIEIMKKELKLHFK